MKGMPDMPMKGKMPTRPCKAQMVDGPPRGAKPGGKKGKPAYTPMTKMGKGMM